MNATPTVPGDLPQTVKCALEEDIGSGDITAALIEADAIAHASVICREDAVICGIPWAEEVIRQVGANNITLQWQSSEGSDVAADQTIARFTGPARALLSAERCMLNFLQTLSGTATLSRQYARLISHTSCRLLDTRKTIPGLRTAQKYAVAVGGCGNHRMGLFDAFLIKENHISACGSITRAVDKARRLAPGKPVEVEVESFAELSEALDARADIIMLDNFSIADMHEAVRQNLARGNTRSKLEASGGITRERLVEIAETGVDYISIGALTKDLKAIDLSMRFERLT
jgi:nicotinate-nucleotide pyrophosphorylase (carboxylating)